MIIVDETLCFLFVLIPYKFRSAFCFTQKMYHEVWVTVLLASASL